MKIRATFVNRKYLPPEYIEMVCAWDEYSVDNNAEGYEADREAAIASLGKDLLNSVTVTIDIDEDAVIAAINPTVTIDGEVRA